MKILSDAININISDMKKISNEYEKTIISDEMKAEFKVFTNNKNDYEIQLDNVLNLALINKDTEALDLISGTGAMGKASKTLQTSIDTLIDMKIADAGTKSDNNTKNANSATTIMLVCIIAGVLIAIALGVIISKNFKFCFHFI